MKLEQKQIFSTLMQDLSSLKKRLLECSLKDAVLYWSCNELQGSRKKFKEEISEMFEYGIFPEKISNEQPFLIDSFKNIRHPDVITYINQQNEWSKYKKEEIIECYQAFIHWLNKISFGEFIRPVLSLRDSSTSSDNYLTFSEWRSFIEVLSEKNERDGLIARMMIQGKKRVSEVIGIRVNQLNFIENIIHFNREDILYEENFMQDLKAYIESTALIRNDGHAVFITRTGKPVTRRRINYAFTETYEQKNINKIIPDSLRNLWDLYIRQKYSPKSIMQSKKSRIEEDKKMWHAKIITQESY